MKNLKYCTPQNNLADGIQKLPAEKIQFRYFPPGIESEKSDYYKLACLYMGLTEMYDRSLTDERSRFDNTEAFVGNQHIYHLSQVYSCYVRKSIINTYFVMWSDVREEIKKHCRYSAQQWVDEYERIWNQYGGN